jgi:putative ABC transport system permease protein
MAANVRQRWLRMVITCGSVALSIGILVVVASVHQQIRETERDFRIPFLMVRPRAAGGTLPFAYIEELRKHLVGAEPVDWWRFEMGKGDQGYTFMLNGASDHYPQAIPRSFTSIDPEIRDRWLSQRNGMVITKSVAATMGWKPGDLVTFHASIGDIQASVVGLYEDKMSDAAALHYDYLNSLAADKNHVNMILVGAPRPRLFEVGASIDRLFENSFEPTISLSFEALVHSLSRTQGVLPDLLMKIMLLSLIVSMLIIGTTIAMSLRERRQEFATLRVMGYRRHRVLSLVFGEVVLTCLIGGLLGEGIVALCFWSGIALAGQTYQLAVTSQVLGIVAASIEGLVAGLVPAVSLVRQSILEGLRSD